MTNLADLARHWINQTGKGKGVRLSSEELDLLNAIGVGEIIAGKAAEHQRAQCLQRTTRSIPVDHTASNGTSDAMEVSEPHSSRSFGMTPQPGATEAALRARERCRPQLTR